MGERKQGHFMTTVKRREVYLRDLTPDQIDIEEIAHALARICRYTGHTREHYSVAQHCVFVSRFVSKPAAFHGLMHDSHEAYLGDPSRPLKKAYLDIDYGQKEARAYFDAVIFEKYKVIRFDDEIHLADEISIATEARDFFGVKDPIEAWGLTAGPARERIRPWPYRKAMAEFLKRFYELKGENRT